MSVERWLSTIGHSGTAAQLKWGFRTPKVTIVTDCGLAPAPREAQDLFARFAAAAEVADITEEALLLRNAYVNAGIVPDAAMTDALHVALATVAA